MNISRQQHLLIESSELRKEGYAALCQLAVTCVLTKSDRRALAEHILRADKIGTGAFAMLTRLLSQKLLYATVLKDDNACAATAIGGSRVSYAIDDLDAWAALGTRRSTSDPGNGVVHPAKRLPNDCVRR